LNAISKMITYAAVWICFAANAKPFNAFNSYTLYQKNYIGLSYQSQQQQGKALFFSFHDHDPRFGNTNFHTHFYYNPLQEAKEQYQQIQLGVNYYINRQLAVQVALPYKKITRYLDETEPYRLKGIGDLIVGTSYHLYNSKLFNPKASIQHIATINMQAKFKTGKFNIANEMNDIDPYLQPGTGSFDVTGTLEHRSVFEGFNLQANLYYTYRGISYYQIKFGNTYGCSIQAEKVVFSKAATTINLLAQLNYQQKKADQLEERIIQRPNTYKGLQLQVGSLALFKQIGIELNTALPVYYRYDDFGMRFQPVFFIHFFFLFSDTLPPLKHLNNN